MAKDRKNIPKSVKEQVLKEFNYRCSICGADRPQLHHIDEDPANNDPHNIIPLCPNCHLIDQHDPTQPIDKDKLKLFRRYRDPLILKPQFHPLFNRLRFLFSITDVSDAYEIDDKAGELIDFINEMEMGAFYAKKLSELIKMEHSPTITVLGDARSEQFSRETRENDKIRYFKKLKEVRENTCSLVIECLRYQNWN